MDYKKLVLMSFIPFFLFANENWDSGLSEAGSLLGTYKGDLDNRVVKPMTTDTPLKTTDGSQSGVVNMTCGSEKPFIKIGYSGTSDISIQIQGDLNFDGSYEKNWGVNGVSGICSNGFIKCDTNTWNNCHYYKWNFNNDNISYEETVAPNLGGCYCINSSCGSLASSQKYQVLNDLAGSIGSLVNNSNEYIISKTQNDGVIAYVWGQSANCNGENVPKDVGKDNIEARAEEYRNNQLSDENSTYYIVNQGSSNVNENGAIDSDFKSQLKDRSITAQQSVNYDKDSKSYSYDDKIDGTTTNVDGSIQMGDVNQSRYCEVEWTETDTTAYTDDTNKENSTSSATTKKSEIRECNQVGDKYICPVDISKGETIKHDCGKVNDFAEVTSGLAAINEAVKDFTCSGE